MYHSGDFIPKGIKPSMGVTKCGFDGIYDSLIYLNLIAGIMLLVTLLFFAQLIWNFCVGIWRPEDPRIAEFYNRPIFKPGKLTVKLFGLLDN